MVNSKIKTKIKTKITTGNRPSAEARILLAARHVFMTKGMSGARMQDIADEAGINKALLHYYFKNKERLFDVIFRDASSVFFPKITGIIESTDTLEKKLEKFCCAYIDMMLQNPFRFLCSQKPISGRQNSGKNSGEPGNRFFRSLPKKFPQKRRKKRS
jgi:AcrR family transcriptional regulator